MNFPSLAAASLRSRLVYPAFAFTMQAACDDYNCADLANCAGGNSADASPPSSEGASSPQATSATSTSSEGESSASNAPAATGVEHDTDQELTEPAQPSSAGTSSAPPVPSQGVESTSPTSESGVVSSECAAGGLGCETETQAQPACEGTQTEACNDCGQRTCNPDTRTWGPCEPTAQPRCNEAGTAVETCDAVGRWQQQTCVNADTTHCDVGCQNPAGTPSCVVTAKDSDDDGYRAAACQAAPGDDCDDTTVAASPDSTEVCDGIDNDCNGYADGLDSDLALAGIPTELRGAINLRRPDLTWHESSFFVVADGKETTDITSNTQIYGAHTSAGCSGCSVDYLQLARLIDDASDYWYGSPRVESANGQLGLIVLQDGRSWGTLFHTLSNTGAVLTTASFEGPPGGGDLTPNGSEFTLATHRAPTGQDPAYNFTFATGTSTGTVTGSSTRSNMAGTVEYQSIAQQGSVAAAVFTDQSESEPSVQLMRWSSGTIIGPTELAQPARIGGITALSGGDFAIAWATPGGFRMQIRATNGTTINCDTQDVSFGNGTLDAMDGVSIAETSTGIALLATDSGGTMGRADLFVFGTDCAMTSQGGKSVFNRNDASFSQHRPNLPRLAVGGGKLGMAWSVDKPSSEYSAYIRVLPESLCQ